MLQYVVANPIITIMKQIYCYLLSLLFTFSTWTVGAQSTKTLPHDGLNVFWGDFTYFTTAAPFTNAIKHSSGFRVNGERMTEVDENGYPTSITNETGATLYIFLETTEYPTGDYTLMWDGEGAMNIQTCDGFYEYDEASEKTQTITISNSCEAGIILTLTRTSSSDQLRNLRLFLPGYNENSGYWTDHYVDYFANFGLVRFAWGSGMYSPMSEWSERVQLDKLTWAAGDASDPGLPYEAMIALANEADADLWINVPPRASNDFELQMAELIRSTLNTNHSYWMEWGNEQWNCGEWGYEGCVYLYETIEGTELDPPTQYAREVVTTADNFLSVFENERDRLVVILGGQTDNAWQLETAATELNRLNRMDIIDVIALGPYFSNHYDNDPLTPVQDQGMDAIMDAVNECMENLYEPTSEIGVELYKNQAVAIANNKPIVAYEGGQHFTEWVGVDPELVAAINRDEQIYDVYRNYFQQWEDFGGSTFVHYTSYSNYESGEAFGMKEYYNQPQSECHKFRAALDWANGTTMPPSVLSSSSNQLDINLFPNPTSDYLHIHLSELTGNTSIQLFTMNGALKHSENLQYKTRIVDVSNYEPGLYILKINQNNEKITKKLIIQ